jgi:hypothetical protein
MVTPGVPGTNPSQGQRNEGLVPLSGMMNNEACETYKMNTYHVPLRYSVQEIRPGKV